MHNSKRQEEFDYYRLEAEKEMSKAMLDANMAEFEAEKKAKEMVEQEERENLIAEANRLTGRAEAFEMINKFANISSLITLKKIKEN